MMRFMRRPNNRPEAVLLERILLTGSCRKDQRYKTASDAFRSRDHGDELLQRGQEGRFPPTKLSAGCGFRKETIAGICRNGRDAPKAGITADKVGGLGQGPGGRARMPGNLLGSLKRVELPYARPGSSVPASYGCRPSCRRRLCTLGRSPGPHGCAPISASPIA